LGYGGAGYLVDGRRAVPLALPGGGRIAAGRATVRRLSDRRLLDSAVVGPSGAGREGRDLLAAVAWDQGRGRPAAYYVVRVAVPDGADAGRLADDLLAAAVSRLLPMAAAASG